MKLLQIKPKFRTMMIHSDGHISCTNSDSSNLVPGIIDKMNADQRAKGKWIVGLNEFIYLQGLSARTETQQERYELLVPIYAPPQEQK